MESANTSTRVKRALAQRAKEGRPALTGSRPFGYNKTMTEVIPEEAKHAAEAAERVLAGEPLRSICRDWEDRRIATSEGHGWRTRDLRRFLTSAFISGQREVEGRLIPGIWPALVSADTLGRLRARLLRRNERGRPALSLLSGTLKCGRCGRAMTHHSGGSAPRRYRCSKQPGTANCGRMSMRAEAVEGAVQQAVLIALEGASLPDAGDAEEAAALEAVVSAEADLAALARDHYVSQVISRTEFFAARDGLQERLVSAQLGLRKYAARSKPPPRLNESVWADMNVDARRAVIQSVLDRVEVQPAKQTGRVPFDHGRLQFIWRV